MVSDLQVLHSVQKLKTFDFVSREVKSTVALCSEFAPGKYGSSPRYTKLRVVRENGIGDRPKSRKLRNLLAFFNIEKLNP